MNQDSSHQLERIWAALGGSGDELSRITAVRPVGDELSAPLWDLVHDSIAAASLQAALMSGGASTVTLDAQRVLTAVTSKRYLRLDGEGAEIWSDLSGFWRCADGWVRTHTNYPHHRRRLLDVLELPAGADAEHVAARLIELPGSHIEEHAAAAGALASRVRSVEEWAAHPVGSSVATEPLIEMVGSDSGARGRRHPVDRFAPLVGLRVLDFTRVIAGPVATRTLALLGADVLRIDSPDHPESQRQHLDTGAGKRSALLRLSDEPERIEQLVQAADVIVLGYRPSALDRFGFDPDRLLERHPGLVVAQIDAWGWSTPWTQRRGFDSIVQAASGIAVACSADGDEPGALPFQALDHSAGYLLAAGVMRAVERREVGGHGSRVRVSLARVAHELMASGFAGPTTTPPFQPTLSTTRTPLGRVTSALPALSYEGGPAEWTAASRPWGSDPAAWWPNDGVASPSARE